MSLHWGLVEIALHLPGLGSLKGKRRVLRPVIEGLRNRFPVSVAEIDEQDTYRAARLGLAVVSGDIRTVQSILQDVENWLAAQAGVDVMDFYTEIE